MMPTQVAHPRRTSWRTFVQTLFALLPTANAVLITIQAFISTPPYDAVVPGWVFATVNFAVVGVAFLAKIVAQVMAAPSVNSWIKSHWPKLAPAPPRASTQEDVTH